MARRPQKKTGKTGKTSSKKKADSSDSSDSDSGSDSDGGSDSEPSYADIAKMAIADLKALVKKRKAKVKATGNKGRFLKADYLNALGVKTASKTAAKKKAPAKSKTAAKKKAPAKRGSKKSKKAASESEGSDNEREQDLSKMKVADLKALCKEKEYDGYSSLKKADLIIFIESGGKTKPEKSKVASKGSKGRKKAPAKSSKKSSKEDDSSSSDSSDSDSAPSEDVKDSGSDSDSDSSSSELSSSSSDSD